MKLREGVLVIGGLSFITLVVFLSLLLADRFQVRGCGCPKVVSHNFVWLFIILAVIFVASLLYFLFSITIEKKEKIISTNIEVLYSILDDDEKRVLDLLVQSKGELLQAQLSGEYDKIKAHRIIKKLQEKNIIEVHKQGKRNKLLIKQELRGELVK